MIMTCKWIVGAVLMFWLITNVSSQPVQPDPVQVLITCMSVLNVSSDHVSHVQRVLWQSTAMAIHVWLWQNVPVVHHEHMHEWQHVLESQMMSNLQDMPHMLVLARKQAHNCHNSLVDVFSVRT